MAARIRRNEPAAPWRQRKGTGILGGMLSLRESQTPRVDAKPTDATFDRLLQESSGYRVDGPEGYLGVVEGAPVAGNPPRPLVLVVGGAQALRFVPLRRVAVVLPDARRVLLWPRLQRREHAWARNGAGTS
jgi:hypothetical protein